MLVEILEELGEVSTYLGFRSLEDLREVNHQLSERDFTVEELPDDCADWIELMHLRRPRVEDDHLSIDDGRGYVLANRWC